jgi:hypothetical protein
MQGSVMPSQKKNSKVKVSESPSEEICFAVNLLRSLMVMPEEEDLIDVDERPTTRMVYTNGVTLWLLILQRLGGGKTLEETISHLIAHDFDLLPDNKRVREKTISENTATYSQARKRLPLEVVFEISEKICNRLGEMSPGVIDGRRVFILDGTTFTLAPTKALQKAFPPATNQHGQSIWPVALLTVANEMQSGCALLPQIDPMYGNNNASEAIQAHRIVKKLPENSVVLADSGYGIFSVAYHSILAGHDFVFRLTRSRFKALRKRAELIDEGQGHKSYRLRWAPSAKDRQSNPDLPVDASIEVVVHEVEIGSGKTLCLVSSLELHATTASEVYCRRYDVEFDIRDVKVTMDAENIRAKSVEMVMKELYTSIVAYNLVAQFRRQAAQLANVKPRRLRFKGIWITFKDRLLLKSPCSVEEWIRRFDEALGRAAKKKHPIRVKARSYPRKAHPRRPKSTKFEKAQRRKKDDEPAETTLK